MSWQDLVFAVGSVAFSVALLPALVRRDPPPLSTCLLTAVVLWAFADTYLTLDFWYSAATTAVTAALWTALAWMAATKEEEEA